MVYGPAEGHLLAYIKSILAPQSKQNVKPCITTRYSASTPGIMLVHMSVELVIGAKM